MDCPACGNDNRSGQRFCGNCGHELKAPAPTNEPFTGHHFVGRELELSRLRAIFDAASHGQGQLVLVVGEPGIGKTALCEQFAGWVRAQGGRILAGHSYELGSGGTVSYLAFVEALRSHVLTRPPEELEAELGSAAASIARLVPEIRELVLLVDLAPPDALGPEAERWQFFQGVSDALRNIGRSHPLLLILEDLHWADQGTLDLLVHLGRNLSGARVLVVGTFRDAEVDRAHPLSAALAELRRATELPRLALRGLNVDEVGVMIDEALVTGPLASLTEAVYRRTEGNPLFVQEVVRDLVEGGLLSESHGDKRGHQGTGEPAAEPHLPAGLRDVIGNRLARLSPLCLQVLPIAALIGRDFRLDTMQRVAGLPEAQVIEGLEEATRAGVLEERAQVGLVRYRFAHALFRQTLYEELSAPRRARMHQEVARALEAAYEADRNAHAAELADHFARSTDPADLARAVSYGELAAEQAFSVYAYQDAVHLLDAALLAQQALELDDPARRCDLLLALAEALGPAGAPRRVYEEVAEAAVLLAEGLGDAERAAQACQLALGSLDSSGMAGAYGSDAYRTWAERADRFAEPGTHARVTADIAQAMVHVSAGRWGGWRALVYRAWDLARHLDDAPSLYLVAQAAAMTYVAAPQIEWQVQLAREVMSHPRDGVSARLVGLFLFRAHGVFLAAGDDQGATECWRDLNQLARHTHDVFSATQLKFVEVARSLVRGDLSGALTQIAAIDSPSPASAGSASRQPYPALAIWPLIWLGRTDEALAAIPDAVGPNARLAQLWVGPRALCHAHVGQSHEAARLMGQILDQLPAELDENEPPGATIAPLLETALVLRDQSAASYLRSRLDGVIAMHAGGVPHAVARHLGRAAALVGDRTAAWSHYERALAWAQSISYRPEIALTRLELAELLLDERLALSRTPDERARDYAEARSHLEFAIAEFEAMGMASALERARQLDHDLALARRAAQAGNDGVVGVGGLSDREVDVLRLLTTGKSNREIADELVLSVRTVERHVSNVYDKLNVHTRAQATAYALQHGLALRVLPK
jgi:predicted ATPase